MPLTDKQERFVAEYLADMNGAAAYVRAGYQVASDQSAASCAHKLLRIAKVAEAIDKEQCARMEKLRINADWVIERFRLVYLRAMTDDDFAAANRALDSIAKCLGIHERDNRQKHHTPADAAAMKERLIALGVDFTRRNAPPHLRYTQPQRPNAGDS